MGTGSPVVAPRNVAGGVFYSVVVPYHPKERISKTLACLDAEDSIF